MDGDLTALAAARLTAEIQRQTEQLLRDYPDEPQPQPQPATRAPKQKKAKMCRDGAKCRRNECKFRHPEQPAGAGPTPAAAGVVLAPDARRSGGASLKKRRREKRPKEQSLKARRRTSSNAPLHTLTSAAPRAEAMLPAAPRVTPAKAEPLWEGACRAAPAISRPAPAAPAPTCTPRASVCRTATAPHIYYCENTRCDFP